MNLDALLFHVQYDIGQALMFRHIPVGSGQQQAVIGMMGAGGPDLLAVDDPALTVEVCTGRGAGKVRPAARFAEELAPGVFTGEYAF